MHTGLFSEHPAAVNVLTDPTRRRTLQKRILSYVFIIMDWEDVENVLFSQIWNRRTVC